MKQDQIQQLSGGFTLIEIIVVVVITGLLSALVLIGYPAARDHQHLRLAEQAFQTFFRDAQNRALNEERDDACLETQALGDERYCSDIGLALRGRDIILFADTADPTQNEYSDRDYRITTFTLPGAVEIAAEGSPQSLLWEVTPPTVTLYADGVEMTQARTIDLVVRKQQRTITIQPYGHVSGETP